MSFLRILLILIAFIFAHVNKLNAKVILLTSFDTWHIYRTNESCFITSKPIPKSGQGNNKVSLYN